MTAAEGDRPWPSELRLRAGGTALAVTFDNGERYELPAEYLRVESPSAEVQGHGADQKTTVPRKRNVKVARLEPIGNYAVRIVFDDGHSTGLYAWDYLRKLGREQERIWAAYLAALAAKGLSRG